MFTNINLDPDEEGVVKAWYCNYKGGISLRQFKIVSIHFEVNEYHSVDGEPCWIILGYDLDKDDLRTYALKDFLPEPIN